MLFKETIPFAIIQNRGDGELQDAITNMTWDSVVDLMSRHVVRSSKNGSAIIPARFKPQDQWVLSEPRTDVEPSYRNAKNVEAITMAIIDIDKPNGIEIAKEVLKKYEFIVYSTHSYTAEQPYKFRVVLKLENEIAQEQWPLAFKCLHSKIDLDKQCGDFSRLYYLPSVSPKADIKPVFIHNKGKAISYDEILQMGDPESLLEKKVIAKRDTVHFSGKSSVVGANLLSKIEWTWETMLGRQAGYVNDLSMDDSRHSFALKVISSEVAKYGDRINIDAIVQFLFKASQQFSSKEMNRGNTPHEIPEFFESALIKFSPRENSIAEYQRANGISLKEAINRAITTASYCQAAGRWNIDEKISLLQDARQMSDRELRFLHYEDMKQLMVHSDHTQFFRDVVATQVSGTLELSPDLAAGYFVKTYGNYFKTFSSEKPNLTPLDKAVKDIADNFDFSSIQGTEGMERFLKASLKKALILNSKSELSAGPSL